MLMLFVTICVGAAFVLRGPLWEKIVIIISAVPIAILANVARITATAVQREFWSTEYLNEHFHDLAGLAMMPLALLLAWGEIVLLHRLFPEERPDSPLTLRVAGPEKGRPRATRVSP
jgi:exosortase/archaeosortase family protein